MSNAIMNSLFTPQFDYDSHTSVPTVQLMIASVPRSGSTVFCNDLWNTGVLGAPMEYFNLKWIEKNGRWKEELNDIERYLHAVQSVRTSPNGVFAYKMFMPNFYTLLRRCPEIFLQLIPTHVIYLTRNDVVAQAVSYAKAIESQQWFADAGDDAGLEYNRESIDEARANIERQKQQWEKLFELTCADNVLRISYEAYLRDKDKIIAEVIRYVVGTGVEKRDLGIQNIEIQRDITNFQWMERYINSGEGSNRRDRSKRRCKI